MRARLSKPNTVSRPAHHIAPSAGYLRLSSFSSLARSHKRQALQQQLGASLKKLTQQLGGLDDVIHSQSFLDQDWPSVHGLDCEGNRDPGLLESILLAFGASHTRPGASISQLPQIEMLPGQLRAGRCSIVEVWMHSQQQAD